MISKISATKERLVIVSPTLDQGLLMVSRSVGKIIKSFYGFHDPKNNLNFNYDIDEGYAILTIAFASFGSDNEILIKIRTRKNQTYITIHKSGWVNQKTNLTNCKIPLAKEQVTELSKFTKPLFLEMVKLNKEVGR